MATLPGLPDIIPTYDEALQAHQAPPPAIDEPVARASVEHNNGPIPPVKHTYGSKEVTVMLRSHAIAPTSSPLYYPNSTIEGCVVLDLPKGKSPQLVRITVQCGVERLLALFKNRTDPMAFDLDRFEPFWKESVVPFAAKDGSGTKQTLGEGTHVFPFQFSIPKKTTPHASIVFDNVTGEHDLPPSFIEARNAITIQYILLIEVKFGFMKINRDIGIPIRHIPITRPGSAPSPTILGSYLLSSPIPTSADEPQAFSEHRAVIAGSVFNQHFIMECKLFLIKPIVYTSGTRIPYYIQLSSPTEDDDTRANSQAVDLLYLPSSISLSLNRNAKLSGQVSQKFTDSLAAGTTWVRRGALEGRILQGEIDVPGGISTDFSFPAIEISHHLQLSVSAPGMIVTTIEPPPIILTRYRDRLDKNPAADAGNPGKLILAVPIKLTNATAVGVPKAPSYAPAPGYGDEPEAPAPIINPHRAAIAERTRFIW